MRKMGKLVFSFLLLCQTFLVPFWSVWGFHQNSWIGYEINTIFNTSIFRKNAQKEASCFSNKKLLLEMGC